MNSNEITNQLEYIEQVINDPEKTIDFAAEKVRNLFMKALGTKSKTTKPKHRKIRPKKMVR